MDLRRAAKARLSRWVKPKSKRVELNAPEFVREQWETGNKNVIADVFSKVNFNQEIFVNQLRILVQKKKLVEVTITEGWFSEQELSSDFGWNKIDGAKARCKALGDSHFRHNMYDGSEEFWVIIKEEGRRQDSLAYEETHEKKAKAEGDPQFAFGTSSLALDAAQKRDASEKQRIADKEPEVESKFGQTKEKFKKFMESMLQKTGRLRSLVKELKTKFSEDDGAKECLASLQNEIKNLDQQYDKCQEQWCIGEAQG
ncbi:unnamed protein product [Cladocopium goreaui]|uniref:Uncharacterized protein n=1 Tax=Cladocopium goreaui TaxID=2562237 RepID=A0A9P1GSW2_9DINO|nr:unnamed protein product [Cladocopium goreaui]